jgi:hypothetical protein
MTLGTMPWSSAPNAVHRTTVHLLREDSPQMTHAGAIILFTAFGSVCELSRNSVPRKALLGQGELHWERGNLGAVYR